MKLKLIKICAVFGILGIFAGCSDNVPPQQEKPQEKQQEKTTEKKSADSELHSPEDRRSVMTNGIPPRFEDFEKDKK